MRSDMFQRLCIPPEPVLLLACSILLQRLAPPVRVTHGCLDSTGRYYRLECIPLRGTRTRRFLFPFYQPGNATAHRLVFQTVLEQTGLTSTPQLNGRPSRGTKLLSYFAADNPCLLLWSKTTVLQALRNGLNNYDESQLTAISKTYPDTPLLIFNGANYSLPDDDVCSKVRTALEAEDTYLCPVDHSSARDALYPLFLQVKRNLPDLGPAQLLVRPSEPQQMSSHVLAT